MACAEHQYNNAEMATEPGSTFDYASIHLLFAGAMVVAALDYEFTMAEIVQDRVLGPAGMSETYFTNERNPSLAGGLRSTANDYEKFLHQYFTGRLIPTATTKQMETDQYPNANYNHIFALPLGHYGLANWYDCLLWLGTWRETCYEQPTHSSLGIMGYYPIVDRYNEYYFHIAFHGLPTAGAADVCSPDKCRFFWLGFKIHDCYRHIPDLTHTVLLTE
eukprot:m.109683 g.109683  ORF g.109683 m.109683 type:complete len:219 (+) comp27975_c0_seq1:528-1184(+)